MQQFKRQNIIFSIKDAFNCSKLTVKTCTLHTYKILTMQYNCCEH